MSERRSEAMEGVTAVEVSLEAGEAKVQAAGALSAESIKETLAEEGYDATAVVETVS